jgi:hypothetical protein
MARNSRQETVGGVWRVTYAGVSKGYTVHWRGNGRGSWMRLAWFATRGDLTVYLLALNSTKDAPGLELVDAARRISTARPAA